MKEGGGGKGTKVRRKQRRSASLLCWNRVGADGGERGASRRRCSSTVRCGAGDDWAVQQRAGGAVQQSGGVEWLRRQDWILAEAGVRWERRGAMGARWCDGGVMARRRRLAVVRAGATRRLAQATTMVETRLAGAAAWL
ncbi:hypothetical protein U1Q18_025982 [Sarracenia purpurea var. burkii]